MEKLACDNQSILTWYHPRFEEFSQLFSGAIAPDGNNWHRSTSSHSGTRVILQLVGGLDVEKTLESMDVEVGLNIIVGCWKRVDRGEIAPSDGQPRT
ncbi:MAG: hypothetical protein ACXW4A_00165 [Nitrospira sp.]